MPRPEGRLPDEYERGAVRKLLKALERYRLSLGGKPKRVRASLPQVPVEILNRRDAFVAEEKRRLDFQIRQPYMVGWSRWGD